MALVPQMVDVSRQQRTFRRPKHTWHIRCEPWELQPMCIAPVLPGETLKNAVFQARTVTDPIVNPLIGWHLEHYWFYVKHRDLAGASDFTAMMLEQGYTHSQQATATEWKWFTRDDVSSLAINFVEQCTNAVVDHYFRNEGETSANHQSSNGIPMVSVKPTGILDSFQEDAVFTAAEDLDVDLNADATITAGEVENALNQYNFLKEHNMTNMGYEEFLASYGVRQQLQDVNKPELLRVVSDWQYPSNTINPSDGAPSSAVSWSTAERMDKDRYFSEPGFIIGFTVARPKVYMRQYGAVANWLNDAFSWLPAMLTNDARVSWKKFNGVTTNTTEADGPLLNTTDDYWVDMRDLFIHGDQFLNFHPGTTDDAGIIAVPVGAGAKEYTTTAEARSLFVDSITSDYLVRSDGVATFNIASHQRDMSPKSVTS